MLHKNEETGKVQCVYITFSIVLLDLWMQATLGTNEEENY